MNRRVMNPLTAVLTYGSLLVGCVVVVLPLLIVFMASFKTDTEFYSTPMFSLPANLFNLQNYEEAFTGGLMLQGFLEYYDYRGIFMRRHHYHWVYDGVCVKSFQFSV